MRVIRNKIIYICIHFNIRASLLSYGGCHCTKFDQVESRHPYLLLTCVVSRFIMMGLFLARIRWFSEQNLDAISTEAMDECSRLRSFQYFPLKRALWKRHTMTRWVWIAKRWLLQSFHVIIQRDSQGMSAPYSSSIVINKNIIYFAWQINMGSACI